MSNRMQAQYTPHPWEWRFMGTAGRWMLVSSVTGEAVHVGGPPDVPLSPDQVLIAAAPLLYDACAFALSEGRAYVGEEEEDDSPNGEILRRLRNALEKATG